MPKTHLENEGAPAGKSKDIVVFMVRRETKCAECGRELFDGNLLRNALRRTADETGRSATGPVGSKFRN